MLNQTLALLALVGGVMFAAIGTKSNARSHDDNAAVAATLDAFHLAASNADGEKYFGMFAPDGVFLGTDATERWNLDEFKAFAKPYFEQGQGWTYTAIEGKRFVTISEDGSIAWFDELLANEKYGTCRGSGVLRKSADQWKIAQYNLSFMIPNDAAKDVVALIKAQPK